MFSSSPTKEAGTFYRAQCVYIDTMHVPDSHLSVEIMGARLWGNNLNTKPKSRNLTCTYHFVCTIARISWTTLFVGFIAAGPVVFPAGNNWLLGFSSIHGTGATHSTSSEPFVRCHVESLINTRTLKKRCALAAHTEVKQTQEL